MLLAGPRSDGIWYIRLGVQMPSTTPGGDEVDDTRTTLSYAIHELEKDVQSQLSKLSPDEQAKFPATQFAIFVVHNKDKPKAGSIPEHIKYFAGKTVGDHWIDYPWEAKDIDGHNKLADAPGSQKLS
ncbi:hypoxanthine-guanine phosphoribosyltransferase [Puccinia graminis f. sp. tritici]|uniref:Hypoxanthine-guanine phosphoribosyltransferase n=1 Tax=Puccinia graminis f. sp. tritici TaxID=56615 RepID=A0A5B0PMG8_PUCGR|nr:hypoxanthine-guanine phosphoribosyltransferase [Puccinia graminis f. sp. tritici]